ncbi:MAG TPA: nucleoside triphosphate pyrophosphohydrolase [Actinomycetota bacterium]|nr:nucleoside triphosphate pyrophosphohydrolase [Actinomycetota bacterium]
MDPDEKGLDLEAAVRDRVVEPSADAFKRLVAVMAKLRTDCPWDREQTHQTLAQHLLEETYETLEAIDADDLDALREELGDLVLQVVFHSNIAYEEGAFTVSDVLDGLRAKLIHRHPHVFGDTEVSGPDDVKANWERIKRDEKGTGVLDGIPIALPALARAAKVYRRAVGVGFSFESVEDVIKDLEDEVAELRAEVVGETPDLERVSSEIGDVLFSSVCVAQRMGVEPETALRHMLERFTKRFVALESLASSDGRELESLSKQEWEEYWKRAKELQG